jgi:hypothetical protein
MQICCNATSKISAKGGQNGSPPTMDKAAHFLAIRFKRNPGRVLLNQVLNLYSTTKAGNAFNPLEIFPQGLQQKSVESALRQFCLQ